MMMVVDAMQRVVSSPELVSEILQYSDNRSCLVVNKLWCNEYLTIAWWDVEYPCFQLFQLLAPQKIGRDGRWRFSRPFTPDDWARFDSYAWRVKQLDMWFSVYTDFDESFFKQLCSGRVNTPLLPNLRELDCPVDMTILRLFACPTVTSLGIHLSAKIEVDMTSLAAVFSSIPRSMPHISYLYIDVGLGARSSDAIVDLNDTKSIIPLALSELISLKDLVIPPSWLTPCVTKAIASLPVLAYINTIEMSDLVDDGGATLPSSIDLLGRDDFLCLRELHTIITLRRALSWFQRCSSTRFSQISLLSPEPESKATYTSILHWVSESMSSCIEHLSLQIDRPFEPPLDFSTIQIVDLKPLFTCQKLKTLELSFPFPFDITVEDILLLVQSLPSLKELELNPSPSLSHHHKPSLHLSCLSALARSSPCQLLESISLYVDTTRDQLPQETEDVSFQRLKHLSLGYSSLSPSSIEAVAAYISRMIPKQCRLHAGWAPTSTRISEEWRKVLSLLGQWIDRPEDFLDEPTQ